ncbi:MAG: hypothetical protein AAF744_06725 [Pseudomonadota bacterium]
MSKPKPTLDFKSEQEFEALCRYLGDRMHYLNRVAMGESGFAWSTADMLKRLGRSFAEGYRDPSVTEMFGDPGTKGLPRADRPKALFSRLYPEAED